MDRAQLQDALVVVVAQMTAAGASEVDEEPPWRGWEEIRDLPIQFDPRFAWEERVEAADLLADMLGRMGTPVDVMGKLQAAGAKAFWEDAVSSLATFEDVVWRAISGA